MRLIDADALLTKAKDVLITDGKGNCAKFRCIDTYHVHAAPTIERPEIVRCKDCKHYDSETQSCLDGLDGIFQPDWFCADGERKDGDGK